MIVRIDYQWTTIQCKNLVSDDGKICDLCFKVLNNRFALIQQCPYCLGEIDLVDWAREEAKKLGQELAESYAAESKNLKGLQS